MSTCRPWGPSRAARTCFSRSIIWWRVILVRSTTVPSGEWLKRSPTHRSQIPTARPSSFTSMWVRSMGTNPGHLYQSRRLREPGATMVGRQSDPRGRKHDPRLRQYRHSGDKLLHSQEPRPGAQQHVPAGLFGHQSRTKDDTDPCLGGRAGVLSTNLMVTLAGVDGGNPC